MRVTLGMTHTKHTFMTVDLLEFMNEHYPRKRKKWTEESALAYLREQVTNEPAFLTEMIGLARGSRDEVTYWVEKFD